MRFKKINQKDIRNIKTPKEAYNYAKSMGRTVPELENIIAQDPKWSFRYAEDIIKGRFKKGEDAIMDSMFGYNYIKEFCLK